jgi:cytochrome c biogenesis protein CcdA/thiol-disulfide isomerase/thioredoxin
MRVWLLLVACVALLMPVSSAEAQTRPTAVLTPLAESSAVQPGTMRLAVTVSLPSIFHVQANVPREAGLIPTTLTLEPPAGVTVDELVYPTATEFSVAGYERPLLVYGAKFVIGVRLTVAPTATGPLRIPGRIRYQACDDTTCFLPMTANTEWVVPMGSGGRPQHPDVFSTIAWGKGIAPPKVVAQVPTVVPVSTAGTLADGLAALDDFDLRLDAGGYLDADAFLQFIADAEAGVTRAGWFEGRGPLAILALVLLGGLALNLTPCVLPMIPINLAIIGAGARAGSRRRGFILGASYGAAMTMVYGAIGLVVILTAGTFGAINASPWFNLGIAVVFVLLGLAMFDVLVLDFSRWSAAFRPDPARQGSVALAFTMGGVAALLAGACVAPVVIQVVVFASDLYASGNGVALALPFVLGLGMALPWPIAGAGLAALPRPGAWMVRVKQAFGIVILATAAYYGYLAYSLFDDRRVEASAVESSVAALRESGWHDNLAVGLATARTERKPVLLDLWATWCKNCLTMDQTTLKDARVVSALAGYVKIKVQAENPDNPDTLKIMDRVNAIGLPAYAILYPR